jgi:predicted alpha/beta hydrolase family esterase
VLVGVALAALVAAWLVGARLQRVPRFPYLAAPLSESEYMVLATRPGWHAELLAVGGGAAAHETVGGRLDLRGLAAAPTDPDAPWVLFFDGNSRTILADGQRFLDALRKAGLADAGAGVWAYRGFDGNAGIPSALALAEDGWDAYSRLIARRALPPRQVHVVGFSIGTSVAVAVAARARGATELASLSLIAPMTELDMLHEGHPGTADRYENLTRLDGVSAPVLVVHSRDDKTLPAAGARLIADRLGDRAHYVEVNGVDHNQMLGSPAVADAVREFIVRHRASR